MLKLIFGSVELRDTRGGRQKSGTRRLRRMAMMGMAVGGDFLYTLYSRLTLVDSGIFSANVFDLKYPLIRLSDVHAGEPLVRGVRITTHLRQGLYISEGR